MKEYILITSEKFKIPINQEQKDAIIDAVQSKEKSIVVDGNLLSLQIVPTIIDFKIWYAQMNEKLKSFNKRLCKKCLCVMDAGGCPCWKSNGNKEQNAFKEPQLPEEVKKLLGTNEAPALTDAVDTQLTLE